MSTTFLKAECSLPYISVMCCGEGREREGGSGGKVEGREERGEKRRGKGGKGKGEERRREKRTDLATFYLDPFVHIKYFYQNHNI